MANEKVTQLPTVVSATLSDIIYAVQGGLSVQETLQQVVNLGLSNTVLNFAGNPNGFVAGTTFQLLWDTTNSILYVCTTTGSATTAVWMVAGSIGFPASVSQGGTGRTTLTAHGVLIGEGTSPINQIVLAAGQVLIGTTASDPVAANLTGTSGVNVASSSGSIVISGSGSGIGWNEVTGTSQAMVADAGYVANNGGLVTLTLPVTAAFGSASNVIGKGAGGWLIQANGGQTIQVGNVVTSSGGSVASTNRFDSIELIVTTANTVWTILGAPQGTLTII